MTMREVMPVTGEDKLHDECGVIGIWNKHAFDTAEIIYTGLYGIQHRGQQSVGIAINDSGKIVFHKELGLITEVFNEVIIRHLQGGKAGIGNVGYINAQDNLRENVQPLVARYINGQMAFSYNGCILNADALRSELEQWGYIMQSSSDSEIIAAMVSRERVKQNSIEDALSKIMLSVKGAYSFLILTSNKLVAVRDPYGMKPLCLGKLEDSYVFASETSALDTIGASYIRDVMPGEIVTVDDKGIRSSRLRIDEKSAMCIFEFVYLARTDSYIDGVNVYDARYEAGKILAEECPAEADLVIGVPDSGLPAAMGFAARSGIPYAEGLIKNRYIGRTFIQPSQAMRERAVDLKLNAIRSRIEGKRIVLVDDSIVRGTTSKKIVQMIKEIGGAKEVHMRISSPPVKYSCYYGIDTPDETLLIANRMPFEEIKGLIGLDSLGYISEKGLLRTPVGAKCNFCAACFNGEYPIEN